MNKYAFLTEPVCKDAVIAEGSGRLAAAYAKHCEPRGVSRGKSLSKSLTGINKNFSLIIRADDGSTLLETHVDYMHQAFQRLIDWSIEETGPSRRLVRMFAQLSLDQMGFIRNTESRLHETSPG